MKAIVDDDLYDYLNQWKWHCTSQGSAMRSEMRNGIQHGILMHRVIMNAEEGEEVDHINHNTLDNRRENLRICSKQENKQNRRKLNEKQASSIFKGVSINPQNYYYEVSISVNGKKKFIGYFISEIAAANAYNFYAKKYYKDFACLNDVKELKNWRDYKINKKEKTSKYKGVYKKRNKWNTQISYRDENNKKCRKILCGFKTEEDAYKAYQYWSDILKNKLNKDD